jgi:hypothetical protein
MKQKYIPTEIETIHKQNSNNIYTSRFDKIFTEISNHYEKTQDNTGTTLQLPTIEPTLLQTKNSKRKILARYVSPEQPIGKQFINVYKDSVNIRNKIDEIKYSPNRGHMSLEDYHVKIV